MSHPLQHLVKEQIEQSVADGTQRGVQVCIYHGGEQIVDAWAGTTDGGGQTTVDGDTLFPVFSISKGVTATIIARLVERGLLDYGATIASYWPEYAANGKENITLGQVLSHQAGVPQMPMHLRVENLGDWDLVCRELAKVPTLWEPGSRHEYHAMSYGWKAGEPACRVTGKTFPELVEEEIKQPLGIERLFIGCPNPEAYTFATLEDPFACTEIVETDRPEAIPWWTQPLYDMMNHDAARRACMPGASGTMNARSVARMYAALAPGGVDGVKLVSPEVLERATAPVPLPDGTVPEHAMGYLLGQNKPIMGKSVKTFGHGGHGGSMAYYDPGLDLAFAYFHNKLDRADQMPTTSPQECAKLVRTHLWG